MFIFSWLFLLLFWCLCLICCNLTALVPSFLLFPSTSFSYCLCIAFVSQCWLKKTVCIIFWFFPCIVSRLFCFSAIHYSSHLCSLFFIAYISPHLSPFWWLFSCFSHLLLSFSSPALNLGAPIPVEHLSYRTKPRKTLGHSLTLPPDLTLTFLWGLEY